jgi:hypothetical protein
MIEFLGVVVLTLLVGLIVWSIRFLANVLSKDARHAPFDEANSEQERT